ncbi:MAG TPA: preprotein translocase subunit YajC [Saprospiraceae bacterium]|nr:preprotein translocase subunit YajC [Saprospiraceae bacterium]HMQ81817.1 preprotein translocase subunit YajC [Saprospiraceae bacterium]
MTTISEILLLQSSGAGWMNMVFLVAMIAIFWLFMIRPQQKKQKEQNSFLDALEKGEEVVTASGIIGRINKIEDQIVTLEVGVKTYIRVTKNAISKEMTQAFIKVNEPEKN